MRNATMAEVKIGDILVWEDSQNGYFEIRNIRTNKDLSGYQQCTWKVFEGVCYCNNCSGKYREEDYPLDGEVIILDSKEELDLMLLKE